jgi:hypothetical protein
VHPGQVICKPGLDAAPHHVVKRRGSIGQIPGRASTSSIVCLPESDDVEMRAAVIIAAISTGR